MAGEKNVATAATVASCWNSVSSLLRAGLWFDSTCSRINIACCILSSYWKSRDYRSGLSS